MSHSIRLTERSLYPVMISLFKSVAEKYNVRIKGIQEVDTGRKYPDILLVIDGYRILVQVKIDRVTKLIEDIVKSYPIARKLNAELVGILFPSEVRQVRPEELEKIAPKLKVTRGLILTQWMSSDVEQAHLIDIVEGIIKGFIEFKKTLVPSVNYLTIAKVARETIEDMAAILRSYMGVKQYFDMAQAIIGRFDFYKAMLEEFVKKEEVMRTYIADIMAYLTTIQLLFAHVVSTRRHKQSVLPKISEPLTPPKDLIDILLENMKTTSVISEYGKILGSLAYILEVLKKVAQEDPRILQALSRYIYTIQVLRPEHVKEELLGRIYQEGLPPETRKNLGAFFTNPKAARLLAELAIERWDEKVLDPACGSGTLLVAAYWAKINRAKEAKVSLTLDELHKKIIRDHIVGIDIMQFAKELTTVNLALQNINVSKLTPQVYYGDGISKMYYAKTGNGDDPPRQISIFEYLSKAQKEYEELTLPHEGIDVVIMNPPFTRRERIPEKERRRLERLFRGIVMGKVGYWAYFFAAADNVIKLGGKLAAVTPEEFFVGSSAESLRRYLLLGEGNKCTYKIKYVIRSAIEVAFSEGARYRDYLMVLEKVPKNDQRNLDNDYMILMILKKRKDDLTDEDISKIIKAIKYMESYKEANHLPLEDIANIIKIHGISGYISEHIDNLKLLVGFNTITLQELFLELLDYLVSLPSLHDLEKNKKISIRLYRPGQYRWKGTEGTVQRLIIARYEERSPNLTFRFIRQLPERIEVEFKPTKRIISISTKGVLPSLWTHAGVKHLDLSSEEEYAIVDPSIIPTDLLYLIGQPTSITYACKDLKEAYNAFASNILLARRVRLTSENTYWLAFYSKNRTLGVQLPNIIIHDTTIKPQILTLYLNSTIALVQLLAFTAEVEGAWVSLDHKRVWSHVRVPDFTNINNTLVTKVMELFNKVSKYDVKPLYERIASKDIIQREIDKLTIELLYYSSGNKEIMKLTNKLDTLYNSMRHELDLLQKIVKESQKKQRRSKKLDEEENDKQLTLFDFFNK